MLCLDAETGKILWIHEYHPPRYSISYPAGPRSTPEIHDGRVYTIGAMGQMFCFDEKTGNVLWSKDFVKDFNTKLPIWGMVASPLIDGDQAIMSRRRRERARRQPRQERRAASAGGPWTIRRSAIRRR